MGFEWFIIIAAATIFPMFKLLPHFGVHQYWSIICILPAGTIILLWVMWMKLQELEKL